MNYESRSKVKVTLQNGFGLIEILIAGAVITVSLLSVVGFFIFSQSVTLRTVRNTEAVSLAEQAMEAVRKLRDESWDTNIGVLTAGTTYYPTIASDKWTLTSTNPSLGSFYTTTIVFSQVNRDVSDNIAQVGTDDPETRKVDVSVSWQEGQNAKDVSLTMYLTNFLDN